MKKHFFLLILLLSCGNVVCAQNDGISRSGGFVPGRISVSDPMPWVNLREYGGRPLPTGDVGKITTATTSGTKVTVASTFDFQVGDGLAISTAGKPTTQSTPVAPTVTSLGVLGTFRIAYKCIGADSLEGLTAASPGGSTKTGPAVFGEVPVAIATISRSSDVVSVTTSTNLPFSSGNYHAMIWNATWPSGLKDGLEYVTITSATSFTYSQTGSNETGTVTSGKTLVWLSNAFIITSITRTNSSNMVITTDVNHEIAVGTSQYPTVVNISGVLPLDMDGTFRVTSVTSNTITVATGYYSNAETGTLNYGDTSGGGFQWNRMGVYAWESNLIACPALAGTTTHYYIYADYTSRGTFSLVGATVPGQNTWRDWGLFLNGTGTSVLSQGYTPPPAAAVPTTAPSSAQNQEYIGTITAINGSTFIVSPSIPTNVSAQGVYHDQSIAIEAADNAACASAGGIVYFSGPATISSPSGYVVNAPFNVTSNSSCRALTWYGGASLTLNDTLTDNMFGGFNLQAFSNGGLPGGASATYWSIAGLGNPLINSWWANGSSLSGEQLHFDHVQITTNGNAQIGVESGGAYSTFNAIYLASQGSSVALDIHGSFVNTIHQVNFGGFEVYAFTSLSGQGPSGMPIMGPLIPNLEIDNNGGSLVMDGLNSGSGKGIELYSLNLGFTEYQSEFDNIAPIQAPYTPIVWTYGNVTTPSIGIKNVTADSIAEPCFSNFGSAVVNIMIDTCVTSGGVDVGGDPNRALTILREPATGGTPVGQNQQVTQQSANGNIYPGPYRSFVESETKWNKPFMFSSIPNMPLAWNTLAVTGVTAVANGPGTIAAGSHTFCVLAVGWNGGDGDFSPLTNCATVSLNGSQGVQINATGLPSGAQGYDILSDGGFQNSTIVTLLPVTYTAIAFNGSGPTTGRPGSGLPLIDQNQVATPLLRLTNGNHKLDITAGTLRRSQLLQANAIPLGYAHNGTLLTDFHMVEDTGILSAGTATITLAGSAAFTSPTSYNCVAQDATTPTNGISSKYSSGSTIVFNGTGADKFNYTCWGN